MIKLSKLRPPKIAIIVLTLVIIIVSGFYENLACQVIYKKGYIIDNNADTLHGWVGCKNWNICTRVITFKADSTRHQLAYYIFRANDIKGFDVPGEGKFIRGCTFDDTLFVRVLVEGDVINLYEFNVFEHTNYYISDPQCPDSFTELIPETVALDQLGVLRAYFTFKMQLLSFCDMQNPKSIGNINMILKSYFDKTELMRIAFDLNNRVDETTTPLGTKKTPWQKMFFAGAALDYSTLKMTGISFLPAMKFNHSDFVSPRVGVDFFSVRTLSDLKLRCSLEYAQAAYNAIGRYANDNEVYYSLRQYTITPAIGLIYTLLHVGEAVEVYAGVNFDLNISRYKGNRLTENGNAFNGWPSDYILLQPVWGSADLKAGVVIHNKWEIAGFYQYSDFIAQGSEKYDDAEFYFSPRRYGIWLGYRFGI